jgi:hypothetical protein
MRRPLLLLAAAALGVAAPARADFVVTVPNATVAPGGTVTLDVTIRSTSTPVDRLDAFGFSFQVTTTGPTRLAFTPTQPDPFTAPNYVLFGVSDDQDNGLPLGTVTTTVTPDDTYVGGDNTPTGVPGVPVAGTELLAHLRLTAATALPPRAGDTFTVSLVNNPSFTFFMNDGVVIPFTATPGRITVAAVPEPASRALLCGGLAALAGGRARRRRSA